MGNRKRPTVPPPLASAPRAPLPNRWGFPHLGVGLALVSRHFHHVLEHSPAIDFIELISENLMETHGYPLYVLDRLVERYPIILHGVGLSIGSVDPLDMDYLARLKALITRTGSKFVSDHLCWTGVGRHVTHDTLPVPQTEEALAHVVRRIKTVQDYLEVPVVLENAAPYIEYSNSTLTEWDFMRLMAEQADCGLLLDIPSVYTSAYNHSFDPKTFIDAIPVERIVYHHMAGHSQHGALLKATLSERVIDPVWGLFQYTQSRTGGRSALIEWDTQVPDYEVLQSEVDRLRHYANGLGAPAEIGPVPRRWFPPDRPAPTAGLSLAQTQQRLQAYIVNPHPMPELLEDVVPACHGMSGLERADVYRHQYWERLPWEVSLYYPGVLRWLGPAAFDAIVREYLQQHPPDHFNIFRLRRHFPEFLQRTALELRERAFAVDVARVERAVGEVAQAPAGSPLSLDRIEALSLPHTGLVLSDALRLLALRYPVNAWLMDEQPRPERFYTTPHPNWLLAFRTDFNAYRLPLQKELYRMLRLLQRGVPIDRSVQRAAGTQEGSAEVLRDILHTLISQGMVKAIRVNGDTSKFSQSQSARVPLNS